jgi:hypothetical protein
VTATSPLRSGVATLTRGLNNDLTVLWGRGNTPQQIEAALHDVLPALIDRYGIAAASLAAQWYDNLRERLQVPKAFTAPPADVPDSGGHALIGWAGDTATDYATFQTLIAGGAQRRVANFARQTVMGASLEDPQAQGWQRESNGGCEFCDMLAARGAVYSEASADFASHDHCNCYAVPEFTGQTRIVKPYTPTLRDITDADRARVRAYIASH